MQLTVYQIGTSCKNSFNIPDYMQIVLAEYHLSQAPPVRQDSGSWRWVALFPSMVLIFDSDDAFAAFLNFLVRCLPSSAYPSVGASGCDEAHYACSDGSDWCT